MHDFRPVSPDEANGIRKILQQATRRERSQDFLDGFPWESTCWFQASLGEGEVESLYLFWDGMAWNEPNTPSLRTVRAGLDGFRRMYRERPEHWTCHLNEIRDKLGKHAWTSLEEPFPILIATSTRGPFIILDGNHRAVAALWDVLEISSYTGLPSRVWVGLSPDMSRFRSING